MKNLALSAIVIILLFSCGCKNREVRPLNIEGKWELESAFGGWTGQETYAPGNGKIVKFEKTTYENYDHGKLVKSGHYQIIKATSALTKMEGDKITNDNDTNAISTFVEITEGKLIFSFEAYDAGSVTYTRISK